MHRFDPTWPQHWPNLGSTLASKAPTSAQLAPTWLKLRPSLAPRWRNFNLDPEQLRPKLRSIWPRTARFDPSRLWLASTPAPFLSIQFSGCGRLSSWSDLNKRIILCTYTLHTTSHVYSNSIYIIYIIIYIYISYIIYLIFLAFRCCLIPFRFYVCGLTQTQGNCTRFFRWFLQHSHALDFAFYGLQGWTKVHHAQCNLQSNESL